MVIRLIKYEAIGMQYGQNVILKNINLTINDGELFVLVGPSGSGKTTLLRMINRLTAPTTGNVYLDEKRVKDYDLRELRLHMGYVLQDSSLFPNLTVGENIAIQLEQQGVNKKDRRNRSMELLDQVGLLASDFIDRHPDELSGGQQQRVAIARSMATQPQLILMDESFSALDPVLRTQQQDLLLKLHRQSKTTVVFVTHDMQEALRLGDRIAVINDGQLQQVGTPNEILERPANRFVGAFFATARPRLGTMTALLSSKLVQKTPAADQSAVVTTVAELASLTPDTAGWLCFQYQGQGFRIQTTDLLHYLGQREDR